MWTASIASPALCCIPYSNGVTYLHVNRAPNMVKRSQPRKNNVSFVPQLSPRIWSKLRLYGVIEINALRNIFRNEERYLRYGCERAVSSIISSSQNW